MAQANSLSTIGITAVKVLARLAAKRAVQQQLRDQGIRITAYPYAELVRQAHEYLSAHPELYVAALERAKLMTARGDFGKNVQKENEPNSMGSAVQILGAKWSTDMQG
jgi:hypothetical protein